MKQADLGHFQEEMLHSPYNSLSKPAVAPASSLRPATIWRVESSLWIAFENFEFLV